VRSDLRRRGRSSGEDTVPRHHLPAVEPVVAIVPDPVQLIELVDAIDPNYSAMVWLGAVLGLRWGEVAGMRVGRVDLLRKTVTVSEQVTRGTEVGRRPTEHQHPRRASPRAQRPHEIDGTDGANPEELLFSNYEGRPLDYSNWRRRVWEPAVKAAPFGGRKFPRPSQDQRPIYTQATTEGDRSAAERLGALLMRPADAEDDSSEPAESL